MGGVKDERKGLVGIPVLDAFPANRSFWNKHINEIDKQEDKKKETYELETYYDEDTGISMLIFKDKLGDVLYCEPVEVEMEER